MKKICQLLRLRTSLQRDEKALEIEHSDADYNFNNVDKDPLTKFKELYKRFLSKGLKPEAAFNQTISIEPFIHNASIYESFKKSIVDEDKHE